METDYPAAHSMDTEWFAVDRDGYVAVFETGEAGAMPVDAAGGEGSDAEFDPSIFTRRAGWIYDADAHLESETDEHCVPYGDNPALWGAVLMFVESIEPLRSEIARYGGKEVPANGSAAVLWQAIPVDVFRRLHDAGACLHCRYHYERDPEDESGDYRGALFVYEHLHDNWISGPYGRSTLPANPIHVSELPEETRQRLEGCRFESLSFRDEALIQPVEHAECASWEFAWMSSDGESIHPFPGEEEHYREYYDQFADDPDMQAKFRMDPPTAPAKPKPGGSAPSPAAPHNHGGGGFWANLRRLFGGQG